MLPSSVSHWLLSELCSRPEETHTRPGPKVVLTAADHSSLKGLMITGATETLLRLRRLCGYYYLDKMILIRLYVEALGVKHAENNCGEGDEDGE